MFEEKLLLKSGTLWKKTVEQTEYALNCGALLFLPTQAEFVEQGDVCFMVRILANLVRKETAKQKQDKQEFNPFLPYEESLFVADISETHVCILNKYNVVNHHLLIITRTFEEQESLLTLQDFVAAWACLQEIDGLLFYNGGKTAGASQRHKHLQLVPLPLTPSKVNVPIESLFGSAKFHSNVATIPELPFVHAFTLLEVSGKESPCQNASTILAHYHSLLQAVGLFKDGEDRKMQSGSYNLLLTRQWMLLIPRSQEDYNSIPVNSLGFAGTLLVRNSQQMQLLKSIGPMTLLEKVGMSRHQC